MTYSSTTVQYIGDIADIILNLLLLVATSLLMLGVFRLIRSSRMVPLGKIVRTILIIPVILGPVILGRGIWALQQPWGHTSQKVFALIFFFMLWVVSLLMLIHPRLPLEPRIAEKSNWLFHAIGSAMFVLASCVVIAVHPERWKMSLLAIGFFGLCLINAVRQIIRE